MLAADFEQALHDQQIDMVKNTVYLKIEWLKLTLYFSNERILKMSIGRVVFSSIFLSIVLVPYNFINGVALAEENKTDKAEILKPSELDGGVIQSRIWVIVETQTARPHCDFPGSNWWPEANGCPHYRIPGRELIHVGCGQAIQEMRNICGSLTANYWTIAAEPGGSCGHTYNAFYCSR